MTEPSHHTAETVAFPAARPELCLDYANTLCWRGNPAPEESLRSLPDLLGWLSETAAMPQAVTAAALSEARAARLFEEAVALREAIYRLFSAVATGAAVPSNDLAALNAALERAPPRRRLVSDDGRFAWGARLVAHDAPALLAPVLWSAADLLVEGGEHRVRRCANEKCLWLFVDRSKAGTRRWCDMAACGNRAKSQRHYARVKAS